MFVNVYQLLKREKILEYFFFFFFFGGDISDVKIYLMYTHKYKENCYNTSLFFKKNKNKNKNKIK